MMAKIKRRYKAILCAAMSLTVSAAVIFGIYDYIIPERISLFADEAIEAAVSTPFVTYRRNPDLPQSGTQASLFGILPLKTVDVNAVERAVLYPGGMPFGVKLYTKGVLVVGMSEVDSGEGSPSNPSYDSGMRIKDVITAVNGVPVNTVAEVTGFIEESCGKPITFTVTREGGECSFTLTPVYSQADGKYKAGLWIRDSTAGIGTVTFIDPENRTFAGLGHGICDLDTGELMPLMKGNVIDVTVNGVQRGISGCPGELKGCFNAEKIGSLIGNTEAGVFGVLSRMPAPPPCGALPVGLRRDITEGPAQIYCTVDESGIHRYDAEIIKINRSGSGFKNFIIRITDPALLEATGGIVQGMSGSPVVQNGKIIGAVTHVLINDPAKGYGIFIENMLANMPAQH